MLSIQEAAKLTGVSPKTIRRRLDELAEHGAVRDGDAATSPWMIPREALAAVGLDEVDQAPAAVEADVTAELRDRVLGAEHTIELLERDAAGAAEKLETVTRERDRARSDLEMEQTQRERAEREAIEHRVRAEERDRLVVAAQAETDKVRAERDAERERADQIMKGQEMLRTQLEAARAEAARPWWKRRSR